jgi:hypothetical protein
MGNLVLYQEFYADGNKTKNPIQELLTTMIWSKSQISIMLMLEKDSIGPRSLNGPDLEISIQA